MKQLMTRCTCGKRIPLSSKCECRKRTTNKLSAQLSEVEKLRKTNRWRKLRLYVLERDGGYCQRCYAIHNEINTANLEAHHIKSAINNIELFYDDTNLVIVCHRCNMQLGTKDKLDFYFKIPEREINL